MNSCDLKDNVQNNLSCEKHHIGLEDESHLTISKIEQRLNGIMQKKRIHLLKIVLTM